MKINDEDIINEYKSTCISVDTLAKKYHVGKIKIRKILSDNNIERRKRGGQCKNIQFLINGWKTEKYPIIEGFHYIAVSKDGKYKTNDYMNNGGNLTSYIKSLGVEIPTLYDRRKYYMITGNYWWEQWFDIIKENNPTVKKCPYCNWETIDIDNKSGAFEQHLMKVHHLSKFDYLEEHPEDKEYFKLVCKTLNTQMSNDEHEYVTCKICGKKLSKINGSHLKKHGITIYEYIDRFGSDDLMSDEYFKKSSDIAHILNLKPNHHFISNGEKEIAEYINSLGFKTEHDRKVLNGEELDIFVPDKNIAFEFDGIYWHNELFKDKNYHLRKTIECEKKGVKLIHIFDDEWKNKKEIVKSRIANILGVTKEKIYARKCGIREVSNDEMNIFLSGNHLQGTIKSSIRYGLYYNNELVSIMTFGKRNLAKMNDSSLNRYEMLRFCSKNNYNIIGGASKLFKYFIREYNPDEVITFADRRWLNQGFYTKIGFEFIDCTKPNYYYVVKNRRIHRLSFRKDILVSKYECPNDVSEHDFCLSKKWYRIYDCGSLKYIWKKMKKLTNDEIIKRFNDKYADKYDYSKVNYQGSDKKVIITCKKHGDFEIKVGNFMSGRGCPKCKFEKLSKLFSSNTFEFIEKAKKIHGDRYDYSKVEYVKNDINVLIGCKKHGYFKQLPLNHLKGEGCPICRYEEISKNKMLSNDEFIERCRLKHGDKYDYSKTIYKGAANDVTVICPIHGEFTINAWSHMNGNGCQKCNSSHLEAEIRLFLLENKIDFEEQKKFDWLGRQSLDFYIPSKNMAIECQGEQHYKEKDFFGGKDGLLKQKVLDERKKRICNEHDIKILYYANKQYNDKIIIDKNELLNYLKK